jgi:site-specific DNA-adenine methylase
LTLTLDEYFTERHPQGGRKQGDFASINDSTPIESLSLNWKERELPERLRTKHVHRLHPYLGKFVPQLVEVFLRKFSPSTVCDPFCGSGTTLIESNVRGIPSIGCDVSEFNCLLTRVKTDHYDLEKLRLEMYEILHNTKSTLSHSRQSHPLAEKEASRFLRRWFHPNALEQLLTFRALIPKYTYKDLFRVVLSRSARSARLTTHYDLDFPKHPQTEPYFCHKHQRICRPTRDALGFLTRYLSDSYNRIAEFHAIQTKAAVQVICGDAREVKFPPFDAIITSPPYLGLIDYHEQHRYAYELLGLRDRTNLEIGPAFAGTSRKARNLYLEGIEAVFRNLRKSMSPDGVAVIVAHDKHGLFPEIANRAGYAVSSVLERNVDRRTGRRSSNFMEKVFIWRPE